MVKMFRRSNGKLYLEYEAYGKTVQKSTRLEDTKQNRAIVQKEVIPQLQRKILNGELSVGAPKGLKFYSESYLRDKEHLKSFWQIKRQVEKIIDYFGDIQVTQLNKSHIKKWVHHRLTVHNNTPKTIREYLTHIRGIIREAVDQEHIHKNVAYDIKLPSYTKKDFEPFSQEEVLKILQNSNEWFRLFFAISFYTGMRTGEVLALTRNDINLEERTISITRSVSRGKTTTPKTKNSIRKVPIFDDLVPYLKNLPKSIPLFMTVGGKASKGSDSINRNEYKALLIRCNIEYRKIYATRHTFIVSMLKHSELSILEIAQLVGHTTTQMIIQNYGKYIKGEHLRIDKKIKLFTDKSTDRLA